MKSEQSVPTTWKWPIRVDDYDKHSTLTEAEYVALKSLGWAVRKTHPHDSSRPEWQVIEHLFRPLNDARLALYRPDSRYHHRSSCDARSAYSARMYETQSRHIGFGMLPLGLMSLDRISRRFGTVSQAGWMD